MDFEIKGKIKPYVRMTQRSKFVNPQAKEYLASKDAIGWQLRQQMADKQIEMIPNKKPIVAHIEVYRPGVYQADLDNIFKAIMDAAQGIVFQDDRYIVSLSAKKELDESHTAWLQINEAT